MLNLEIIEYFPKGIRRNQTIYTQEYTVNLPIEGPPTIDVIEDVNGEKVKREVVVHLPVNQIAVPYEIWRNYRERRNIRKKPYNEFRFPNELVANISRIKLEDGSLHWEEDLTDWCVIDLLRGSGIPSGSMLYQMPKYDAKIISKAFAPSGPMAVVTTTDERILLGVRGGKAHFDGRIIPFPSGFPTYNHSTGVFETPWTGLNRESLEELGLALYSNGYDFSSDVKDVYLIGVVRGNHGDNGAWNPTPVFVVDTKLTSGQLRELHRQHASEGYEHERVILVDNKALATLMKGDYQVGDMRIEYSKLIDNGVGAKLLYGRHMFGDGWYEDITHELTKNPRYETVITEGNPFR
ncbi:MAG: NUDIX hydrolase [Candidatus Aenigmarchaeota archaeon]|nr:NUDIX hydrolase [Candidatus Aenigmarchaeota archaeon]